jgi:hypothetical protein
MNDPMSLSDEDLRQFRTALVIAHPGHECRVFHWTETLRPHVAILTDGSGRTGSSRLRRSATLLRELGATPSGLFGACSDARLYQAVLQRDFDFFRELARALSAALVEDRVEAVLGDSAEGEIMAHDLFREVRAAAVTLAQADLGYALRHFEFPLESHPLAFPPGLEAEARCLRLDAEAFRRKIATVRGYEQLAPFVEAAFARYGEGAFALERIFPYCQASLMPSDATTPLGYEEHGRRQQALGNYQHVITRHDHLEPIAQDLRQFAAEQLGDAVRATTAAA